MAQGNADINAENGGIVSSLTKDEELRRSTANSNLKKSELVSREQNDEGKVYPPARRVAAVMLALYLSLFLVSLVSSPQSFPPNPPVVISFTGPHNHRHSCPPNH
jgi:hypothetical protein